MFWLMIISFLLREPAQAGRFYPGQREELFKVVSQLIESTQYIPLGGKPEILFSPHAGYIYSGKVAAQSYREIQGDDYDLVVILAPAHYYPLRGISVGLFDFYRTPLGNVEVEKNLGEKILKLKFVNFIKEAHLPEHSIEVQLPFLQYVLKNFRILPFLVGSINMAEANEFAHSLVELLKGKNYLILVSTDLSHYKSYEIAKKIDSFTIKTIIEGDPQVFLNRFKEKKIELCGFFPTLIALKIRELRGNLKAKKLLYLNSGDIRGGRREVVGYASIVFYREFFNEREKKFLLNLARESIKRAFEGKDILREKPSDPRLLEKRGVFVTLRKNSQLRGCIGIHKSSDPLYITVQKMARAAAFQDPRFSPLRPKELNSISIEISVYLYPPRKIDDIKNYIPGKHGIIMIKGLHEATFLPEVPLEQNWNKTVTLQYLSLKAGLPKDGWKEDCIFYIYETVHFSEKE